RGYVAAVVTIPHLILEEDMAETVPLCAALQWHDDDIFRGADAATLQAPGVGVGTGTNHQMNGIKAPEGWVIRFCALRAAAIEGERQRYDRAFGDESGSRNDVFRCRMVEGAEFVLRSPAAPIPESVSRRMNVGHCQLAAVCQIHLRSPRKECPKCVEGTSGLSPPTPG